MTNVELIPSALAFTLVEIDPVRGAVEALNDQGEAHIADTFLSCLQDTLERTLHPQADGSLFVITGDIPAMWLRDSSAQLSPYLPLLGYNRRLQEIVRAVLQRQFDNILRAPYANAFNPEPNGASHDPRDLSDNPWIWEEKYEVDSLAFPIQLAHEFRERTGRTDHLDDRFRQVCSTVLGLWTLEQDHWNSDYRFVRTDAPATDSLPRNGKGTPVARTGMTWSGFRPSDDACTFGYNIPANLVAVRVCEQIAELARGVLADPAMARRATKLGRELLEGVNTFGVVDHPEYGRIYAYEVDGLGNHLLMDDANMPSLLSLPLHGAIDPKDAVYEATVRFALSPTNPYFFSGAAASGIGSPHTPTNHIWPIALSVQGLVNQETDEKLRIIRLLGRTDAGTGQMHESFHADDPTIYTRPWFSWSNAMFCRLVIDWYLQKSR